MPNLILLGVVSAAVMVGCCAAEAQTPIPLSPQDFVMAAAQLAEVQGQDPRVRTFAEEMIRDHERMTEDLRRAAVASGLQPPGTGLSSDQAALLSGLQSLRGADFDKTYARQQELAHRQAVAVEESFADQGADPNLRKAAQSALPIIRDHLKTAQQLRGQLGGR